MIVVTYIAVRDTRGNSKGVRGCIGGKRVDQIDDMWEVEGRTYDANTELCILAEETVKS